MGCPAPRVTGFNPGQLAKVLGAKIEFKFIPDTK